MADFNKEAAAKAAEQYEQVDKSSGVSLGDLIKAVQKAQQSKRDLKTLSKKELKAKLKALKSQAAAEKEADAVTKSETKALEDETARIEEQTKFDQAQVDKAARRTARLKAVEAARQRRILQVDKVKQLQRTVEAELKLAWTGSLDQRRLHQLKQLQTSLKSAWTGLPQKLQYQQDRERLDLNDKLIAELEAALLEDQKIKKEKEKFVKLYGAGYDAGLATGNALRKLGSNLPSFGGLGTSRLALAANMVGGAGRRMGAAGVGGLGALLSRGRSGLGTAVSMIGGGIGGLALVTAKRVASAAERSASSLKDIAGKAADGTKYLGSMFARLWRVIRNPLSSAKAAGSFLGKAIAWGALLSMVVVPVVKGLFKELAEQFSLEALGKYYDEAKKWLYEKITSWFTAFFTPQSDEQKFNLAPKTEENTFAGPPPATEFGKYDSTGKTSEASVGARYLRENYSKFKRAQDPEAKIYFRGATNRYLNQLSPQEIPADLVPRLQADGFNVPTTAASAPKMPMAKAVQVTMPSVATGGPTSGAPADGGGAKPVMAKPPSASTGSEGTGPTSSASHSTSGLSVAQIPRSIGDDSLVGFNTGVLVGY